MSKAPTVAARALALCREHPNTPATTLYSIGAAAGISQGSIQMARAIFEAGTPAEIAAVADGNVGLPALYHAVRKRHTPLVNGRATKNALMSPLGRKAAERLAEERSKRRPGGPKRAPTLERELAKLFVIMAAKPSEAAAGVPAAYAERLDTLIEWLIDVSSHLGEN